jgi:hypothetical protein
MTIQSKLILAIVVAIAFAVAITLGTQHYIKLRDKAELADTREGVLTTTSQGVADSVHIDQAQNATNAGLAQGRETFHTTLEEAKRNEPETANRAVRPVPDSVRNAAAERRRARERLGCAGRECQ